MGLLIDYSYRLFPGLFLIGLFYLILPKKNDLLKTVILILGFILMRDTMTPLGLWEFGVDGNIIWLRFIDDSFILITIALFSLILSLVISRSHSSQLNWFTNQHKVTSILMGMLAAMLVAVPFMIPYFFVPLEDRGGFFPPSLRIALLLFTLFGNCLEEVLFRGLFQSYIKKETGKVRSILLSGLFFAVSHTFLAITVTDLGIWILVFTLYEGIICAIMYEKYGLMSATLTHGLAIFLISAGFA